MPEIVRDIMKEIQDNIGEMFDIKDMVIKRLTTDRGLLNEIFLNCGNAEFKFIERSGLTFGFAFGIIQMIVWIFLKNFGYYPCLDFL